MSQPTVELLDTPGATADAADRSAAEVALDDSLAAGAQTHPKGAASVKEMFDKNGALQGWAVMLKTSSGASGDDWFWYEHVQVRV